MILIIPDELREEFVTFLEVGLASVTSYPDEELTPNEHHLVEILKQVKHGDDIPEVQSLRDTLKLFQELDCELRMTLKTGTT